MPSTVRQIEAYFGVGSAGSRETDPALRPGWDADVAAALEAAFRG